MTPGKRFVFALATSALIVASLFVLLGASLEDFQVPEFQPVWLLVALATYLPCALLRAFRMRHLIGDEYGEHGLLRIASVMVVHQSAGHILPLKLGEFTYSILMRFLGGSSFLRGVGSTVLMRFADLTGLGVVLLAGIWWVSGPGYLEKGILALGAILLLLVGFAGLVHGHRLLRFVTGYLRPVAPSIAKKLEQDLSGALEVSKGKPVRWVSIFVESALLWCGLVLLHCALGCALGLCLSPPAMSVGALGSILCSYLPVATVLNLGTAEFGWVATLPLVGVEPKMALAVGLYIHLGLIAVTSIFAGIGAIIIWRAAATVHADPEEDSSGS